MYVNPFLLGVITTLFVEIGILFIAAAHCGIKEKKNKNNKE